MSYIKRFYLVVYLVFLCSSSFAEEVSNYADCDVCHGAIHFSAMEAKALLGIKGLMLSAHIPQHTVVKIDLDGILKNGSKDTPDDGYEIQVWGQEIIYIKDLRDRSLIQVVTSSQSAAAIDSMAQYNPQIYLESSRDDEIELTDSIDIAWIKMKHSNIYQWVGDAKNKDEWLGHLRTKIFLAMEMLGK